VARLEEIVGHVRRPDLVIARAEVEMANVERALRPCRPGLCRFPGLLRGASKNSTDPVGYRAARIGHRGGEGDHVTKGRWIL